MFPSSEFTRRAALAGLGAMCVGGPATAQTLTRVRVASTVKEIFDNLALYVARDAGMFKAENLEVDLTHFAGGGEVVRAIASGALDIGMVATTAAIIAAARGEPLKIISAYTAPAYGIVYVVATDSPIKSVKDLAGKRVGITRPGSVSHTGLNAALQANAIQADLVPVGAAGDGWAVLKAGRIQATWHTAPEVYSLVDRGEARIVFQLSDYLTEYQQGALIALETYLRQNSDATRRFLRALVGAGKFIDQNPAEAAKIGANNMGSPEAAMSRTLAAMPKGFFYIGAPQPANFRGSLKEALETGTLKTTPDYDKLVDRSFLP